MSEPRWNDPQFAAGTMIRASLWLVQVVGEGNVFTKEQLRDAFPGVAQADRRVRDLRDYGWVLDTSASDASLLPEEQRFVRRGVDVWDPRMRREAGRETDNISNKEREAVLAASGFQCTSCGIAGGEAYGDRPSETAVLGISRRVIERADGSTNRLFVSECKRCRSGAPVRTYSLIEVRSLLEELSTDDLSRVRRWADRGIRGTTAIDRAWNGLRNLPAAERSRLLRDMSENAS